MNTTRKRLAVIAKERNYILKEDYQFQLRQYTADQFVYIDKCESDKRTRERRFGYALSGY